MFLIALTVYGGVKLRTGHVTGRLVAERLAEATTALAKAHAGNGEVEAARQQAFAAFDAGRQQDGEAAWARALEHAPVVDKEYAEAARALQAAFMIDGARSDVRGQLADVLYQRALLAERDHRAEQRDEMIGQMRIYDPDKSRISRWEAPGQLSLATRPAATQVELFRYEPRARGKLEAVKVRDLGATPVAATLAPGSYLLILSAPGRFTTRYPVLIGRDEQLKVEFDLPLASEVPDGFVYVPPGRFLFGSAGTEAERRDFLRAVPLHQVQTGGYYIARHETTFADWITFLESLPAAERVQRTPKIGQRTERAGVELQYLGGGQWELAIQPTTVPYRARRGAPIHYRSRTKNAVQDWLKFPVSGISADDADAYVAWLRAGRHTRNARLCSEIEWERAARGADERAYPHGDRLEPDEANFDQTYDLRPETFGPDEVGLHPGSRSPFGVDDMAGNVSEWTHTLLSLADRVIRGSGYYFDAASNWVTNRTISEASMRDPTLGMRVCATIPPR
jgi:formylglycine-generating enzyme required for sulfatase activity